jgi:protocatechuate 3,4-dioxygenase alpha subunit
MKLHSSGSQTVGPFFSIGLSSLIAADPVPPGVPGERVLIRGRVLDGGLQPVSDAVIEIWQANADGAYPQESDQSPAVEYAFQGFIRVATDDNGAFRLATIRPGRVSSPGGSTQSLQAPHLVVLLFMRGLLRGVVTRMYFPDGPGNDEDPILGLVPPERRATLIAQRSLEQPSALEWNIQMQGPDETVFFEY